MDQGSVPFVGDGSFPLLWDETNRKQELIKWSIGKDKHEISTTILTKVDVPDIVAHVLSVMHKVNLHVGDEQERYSLYVIVMPRTLSIPLLAARDVITAAHTKVDETVKGFHKLVKYFIKAHATDPDRHDLLAQLRSARKPRSISVQLFYYRLRELNNQAAWLPGDEALLSDEDLKQAFFDGMPLAWKEKFLNAGKTVRHSKEVEVLRYFRHLQANAEKLAVATVKAQKKSGRYKRGARDDAEKIHPHRRESKGSGSGMKYGTPQGKKKDQGKSRVDDDEPCPVHKDKGHTWGECNSNAYNKNKKVYSKAPNANKKGSGSAKKGSSTDEKVDSHAMKETVIAPAWCKRLSKEAARPKRQVRFDPTEETAVDATLDPTLTVLWGPWASI